MSSRFSSQYVRKCFLKCLNFLAKILNSERILTDSKNSDRAPIGIVRLVRSLADRTFQLRSPPASPLRHTQATALTESMQLQFPSASGFGHFPTLSESDFPTVTAKASGDRGDLSFQAKLKGSIGEGPNHSNFSHQSSVKILSKFITFC